MYAIDPSEITISKLSPSTGGFSIQVKFSIIKSGVSADELADMLRGEDVRYALTSTLTDAGFTKAYIVESAIVTDVSPTPSPTKMPSPPPSFRPTYIPTALNTPTIPPTHKVLTATASEVIN